MTAGGSDPLAGLPHLAAYMNGNFREWQRSAEGLCVACGDRPPIEGQRICFQCGGVRQSAAPRNTAELARPDSVSGQTHARASNDRTASQSRPMPMPMPKAQAQDAPLFNPKPWKDLARECGKAVRYLAADLLPEGGMSILGAPPKCGKSTLARCAAAAVAGAKDEVLGRSINEHGPVVYFNLEGPPAIAFEHFGQIDRDSRVQCVLNDSDLPAPKARLTAMEQLLKRVGPRLVVVDTLAKYLADLPDINDYGMVCKALGEYDAKLSDYRTHIMWIHHCGKDSPGVSRRHGAELLGSTGLQGSVDTILIMKWLDGEQRQVYSTNRAGAALPQLVLKLVDGWVLPIGERKQIDRLTLQDRVAAYLSNRDEWVPLAEIKKDVEGRDGEIVKALAGLLEAELIAKQKQGNRVFYSYAHAHALGTGTAQERNGTLFQ